MCTKGLVLALSRLSLWNWSWHFDRTLQVFIIVLGWSTIGIYGFHELKLEQHQQGQWNWDSWSLNVFTIRQHDNRSLPQRTTEGSVSSSHKANNALWIETHQPWARFVIHQSLTTTVVQIVWLSKSTLSPDEDLQCAVKTSRSISKWQSWDKQ